MRESRSKKATRNVIYSILQNIANILITLVARIVFVHVLDASYLGINGLFTNILGLLSMADLGMSTAMMYHLYKPIVEKDEDRISELVYFFRRIYLGVALTILVLGLLLLPFLKYIINLDHDIPHLYAYYILALLNVVITYLFVYRTTLVSADQKNYLLSRCIIVFKIITCVAQIIVLFVFRNYFIYLLVALILNFACDLYQNKIALKEYPFLRKKAKKLDKKSRKAIFRDIKALLIYRISGTLQTNTDSILISMMVGTIFVGYYSNYTLITTNIIIFISLIFNNVKASVGSVLHDKASKKSDKMFLFDFFEFINFWTVAFASISFFVLSRLFMQICFGEKYVLGPFVVFAIVLNFYTANIRQTTWVFRETTGIFDQTKYITTVTAILNVGLSIVMGYKWGLSGILIATVIARMVYAWWKEPTILFREHFHTSSKKYIIRYLKRLALVLVLGGITYAACFAIPIQNKYFLIIIQAIICLLLPNAIILLIYRKTAEFQYLITKMIPFERVRNILRC